LREHIQPILLPKARALLEEHRARGHELVIITATNRFITGPIAELLGVERAEHIANVIAAMRAISDELGLSKGRAW
ncbi:MAG: haloacid dehalogenase-like hydrolase, partial [Longimicrobiales bacterium]|nr:haloacid dehalogenase-like hydrolase [Longimicrobiales bacterium]